MSRETLASPRNQMRRRKEMRAKCVTGSRRFRTQEQAEAALERIQASGDPRRLSVPQRVFACPHCAGFHLSKSRTPLVSRTPIPPRSAKTARVYRATRIPLVVEILAEHPYCQIRFDENCTGRATTVHEIKKRSRGGSTTDKRNCLSACQSCNEAVENFPIEAHARGFAAHSWENVEDAS